MNRKSIKAVIFDLGRVLVDVDLRRGIFKYIPVKKDENERTIMAGLFADPTFRDFAKGKLTPHQFYSRFKKVTGITLEYDRFVHEWCAVFTPMPGMKELVEQVKAKYPIGLLSDIGPLHWQYLVKTIGWLSWFPAPVLSFEQGCLKPDPRCYLLAATRLNQSPNHCLFIDDRSINVDSARRLGMEAILFRSVDALRQALLPLITE